MAGGVQRTARVRRTLRSRVASVIPCAGCIRYRCPDAVKDAVHRSALRQMLGEGGAVVCDEREAGYWERMSNE
jgi:hypothetical protein